MKFKQIDTLTENHIIQLCEMYRNEWWSTQRRYDDVKKMLSHTDISIAFIHHETESLAGFCRIMTDYVYKAVIMDVIVAPAYRNKRLGIELMNAAVHHPKISEVETIDLWCLENMIPFYERWDFTHKLGEVRFMRREHHKK